MPYVGTVRVYEIDAKNSPDPTDQSSMPDPETESRIFQFQHCVELPTRAEDGAPMQGAQNRAIQFVKEQDEESIVWQQYILEEGLADRLMVTFDWQNHDEFGNKLIFYLASLVGVEIVRITTVMPDSIDEDEVSNSRMNQLIELRYATISHIGGPTLNKVTTADWYHKRQGAS